MNIAFIVVGAVLLLVGVFMTVKKKPTEQVWTPKPVVETPQPKPEVKTETVRVHTIEERVIEKPVAADAPAATTGKEESAESDPKSKGNDFEGFVADVVKANGLKLKEWNQGTTSPEGHYAENELNPDFKVAHKAGDLDLEYWIECKWRSQIPGTGFSIEDYQLKRYKGIQGSSKRKIIIALGVAGAPTSPNRFYLIPLDTLYRYKRIPDKYLSRYLISNPRTQLSGHIRDWFFNDVFKKK